MFRCSISVVNVRNITKAEYGILRETEIHLMTEGNEMNSDIRELNRIICKPCDEKDYEKCKNCKIYQLVNKIAAQ